MKKHSYRSVKVKDINIAHLHEQTNNQEIVIGIDVAKEGFYGVFMTRERGVILTFRWQHPEDSQALLDLMGGLPAVKLEAAMEPSGSYGDWLRYQLEQSGVQVFRVSSKHSHDYHEVYDGVPSSHDAKSAAVVAELHLVGKSAAWETVKNDQRKLRATTSLMSQYQMHYHRLINVLEGLLASHWPEVTQELELTGVSLLALLEAYGSPQAVAAAEKEARALLRKVGGWMLPQEKIDKAIRSSVTTLGVPPIAEEQQLIKEIAAEARRSHRLSESAKQVVERQSEGIEAIHSQAKVVGKATAAILYSTNGDPREYESAAAYLKSFGLNLKEKSSGTHKGELKITKRGPGVARKYLYMGVLRLIQTDEVVKAWYQRKVKRDGGKRKGLALVAVMRKLVKALWHVGRGKVFDSRLLFNVSLLKMEGEAA
jgi:transposase